MYNKLNPTVKAKTLKALRSGRYEQVRGVIKNGEALCCIGVAAHANGLARVDMDTTDDAANYVGLFCDDSDIWVRWNDQQKLSFTKIADLIEEHY